MVELRRGEGRDRVVVFLAFFELEWPVFGRDEPCVVPCGAVELKTLAG